MQYFWRCEKTYILESLLGAPPVTLATRRRASSALKSFNWVERSVFDFSLSSWTLILAVHVPFHNTSQDPNVNKKEKSLTVEECKKLRLAYPWRLRLLWLPLTLFECCVMGTMTAKTFRSELGYIYLGFDWGHC